MNLYKIIYKAFLFSLGFCGFCNSFFEYTIKFQVQEKQNSNMLPPSALNVGVSTVDITPPPGMPLAGYSLNAKNSKGFRHKLKARIIVIRNIQNQSIVLIQADLLSGSKIVRHKLAELISKNYPIDFHSITFFGTHTHAGPGNYFESNFYNFYAANLPGFDFQFYEYLINQIYDGFVQAWENQTPAKIAFGKKEIYGYTKNRSIEAYKKNPNIDKKISEENAIQPTTYLIRVDSLNDMPITAITNFSIHPTILPESNFFYHRDVFGYIEKGLEDLVKKEYSIKNFVHIALNYTHGDLTPNYDDKAEQGDFTIAKIIGYGIAKEMFNLFLNTNQFLNNIELNSIGTEIDYFKTHKINNVEICKDPVVGMSMTTGATTRQTPLLKYLPFFRPGWPRWIFTDGCQGEKRWYLSKLQYIFLPKEDFPHILYFQALQLNNWIYLPFPFEITAESGNIIQNQIQKIHSDKVIIPISCANGYTGYTVTPYEYSLQFYEGGHTLYGKDSTPFLAEVGNELVKQLFIKNQKTYTIKQEITLKAKSFYPKEPKKLLPKREEEHPPKWKFEDKESYWYFRYWDIPLYYIELHKPLIILERNKECKSQYKEFLTEDSLDLSIHYIKSLKEKTLYEVRWYIQNSEIKQYILDCFRFKIEKRKFLDTFYSKEFFWKQ